MLGHDAESDRIETVDAEPVLTLDVPLAGLGAGVARRRVSVAIDTELAELIEDAERYAAASQAQNASDWRSSRRGVSATGS